VRSFARLNSVPCTASVSVVILTAPVFLLKRVCLRTRVVVRVLSASAWSARACWSRCLPGDSTLFGAADWAMILITDLAFLVELLPGPGLALEAELVMSPKALRAEPPFGVESFFNGVPRLGVPLREARLARAGELDAVTVSMWILRPSNIDCWRRDICVCWWNLCDL
jgi:hypothetical protein